MCIRDSIEIASVAIGSAPTLIVLEDGQHLDSASWDFIATIRDHLPQVGVALGVRPSAAPDDARRIDAIGASTHMVLDKLSADDTVELVQQRLGVRNLPDAIRDLIEVRTAGHPFFSEELALALRDQGAITVEDGACRLAVSPEKLKDLTIPDTVQGVVTSRIDRLAPASQILLKTASVVGYSFD